MITIPGIDGKPLTIYDIDDYPYEELSHKNRKYKKRYKASYIAGPAAFDIETTSIKEADGSFSGFMYNWQFCFKGKVVMGRRWEEFQEFIVRIRKYWKLNEDLNLVVYVHNLAFEFQFLRNYFDMEKVFARDKRDIVTCNILGVEFRCSYRLTNMSFKKFCENSPGVTFYKQGDFDYKKLRTPDTPLTDQELLYCYCDVAGLCQCLESRLKEDTIVSIPLTSTGYVRRDFRKAMATNWKNWQNLKNSRLSPKLYALLNEAFRGGNTHANPRYSNILMTDGGSYDIKSSYPHQMMKPWYPVTAFFPRRPDKYRELVDQKKYACIIKCTFYGLRMKHPGRIPYIARSKCTWYQDCAYDNGRIYRGDAQMTITDIDFRIIERVYDYDSVYVQELYSARYGYLPKEFREKLMSYFREKEEIKSVPNYDEYIYARKKALLNSSFGMCVQKLVNDQVVYDPNDEIPFRVEWADIEESLDKYYSSRKSFLSWQWGVWITANAREQLQDMLDIIGDDIIYCDTDSAKFVGNYDKEVEKYNQKVREADEQYDIPAFIDVAGKRKYLGEFDREDPFDFFITQGAKKYAYVTKHDKKLHVTVSGLSKKKGAEYFEKIGGIDKFRPGVLIPEEYSGRTVSYYKDRTDIEEITIEGCTFTRGSSIGITETTYTLGVTDEYEEFRGGLQKEYAEEWLTENM